MSRKRRDLKVIMRGYSEQRPESSDEERKNIKAGLKKFFGKPEERSMVDITFFCCGGCSNTYSVRPARCASSGVVDRWNRVKECEKYPMREFRESIVAIKRGRNDDGLSVSYSKADGSQDEVTFHGDDAWERQLAFCRMTGLSFEKWGKE